MKHLLALLCVLTAVISAAHAVAVDTASWWDEQMILHMTFDETATNDEGETVIPDVLRLNTAKYFRSTKPETDPITFGPGATPITKNAWLCSRNSTTMTMNYRIKMTGGLDRSNNPQGLKTLQGVSSAYRTTTMWVKPVAPRQSSQQFLVTVGADSLEQSGNTDQMSVLSDGKVRAGGMDTTVTLTPDKWYFIATSFDQARGQYKVFINGDFPTGGSYSNPSFNPALPLAFVCGMTEYAKPNSAWIDDLRVYNRMLGDQELLDLYHHYLYCGNGICDVDFHENPDNCHADCSQYSTKLFLSYDLIAHYTFDNSTAAKIFDNSGNGMHLYSFNSRTTIGTTEMVAPAFKNCVKLNDDFLKTESAWPLIKVDHFNYPVSRAWKVGFTWSGWIMITQPPTVNRAIFGIGKDISDYGGVAYALLMPSKQIRITSAFWSSEILTTATVEPGFWHHFVYRWNGAFVSLYLNGVRINHRHFPHSIFEGHSMNMLEVGKVPFSISDYPSFTGFMDDVRLYRRAISDREVSELFNCRSDPTACRGPYVTGRKLKCGDGVVTYPAENCETGFGCSQCLCQPGFKSVNGTCVPQYCRVYGSESSCVNPNKRLQCVWCPNILGAGKGMCSYACVIPVVSNVKVVNNGTQLICSYSITKDDNETDDSVVYWKTMLTRDDNNGEEVGNAVTSLAADGKWKTCIVLGRDSRGVNATTRVAAPNVYEGSGIYRFSYSSKITTDTSAIAANKVRTFHIASPSTPGGCSWFGSTAQYGIVKRGQEDNNLVKSLVAKQPTDPSNSCKVYLGLMWNSATKSFYWISNGQTVDNSGYAELWVNGVIPDVTGTTKMCVCMNNDLLWSAVECPTTTVVVAGDVPLPTLCEQRVVQQNTRINAISATWTPKNWTEADKGMMSKWFVAQSGEHLQEIVRILTGSPFTALWNGVYWDGTAWKNKATGTVMPNPLPWSSAAETVNPSSRPFVAVSATTGKWITFNSSVKLPYLSETAFLDLTTTSSASKFNVQPLSTEASSFRMTLDDGNDKIINTSLTSTTSINNLPVGTLYTLYFNKGTAAAYPGMSWVRISCDCTTNLANDGKPSVQLVQQGDSLSASWYSNSLCENRASWMVDSMATTEGLFPSSGTCTNQFSKKTVIPATKQTGETVKVCATATKIEGDYESPDGCGSVVVQWQSKVIGVIRVQAATMPDVMVDWWMADAPEVNGVIGPTGIDGLFTITIASTSVNLRSSMENIMLRPRYTAFGTTHKFELSGCQATGGCVDNITLAATVPIPRFDTKDTISFNDLSSFKLSGAVYIKDTAQYNKKSAGDCYFPSASICYVDFGTDKAQKKCNPTDSLGRFTVMTNINARITVWPEYSVSGVPASWDVAEREFNMTQDIGGAVFNMIPTRKLYIRAGGGKCILPIADHDIKLVSQDAFCGYERDITLSGSVWADLLDLPPLTWEVQYIAAHSLVNEISDNEIKQYMTALSSPYYDLATRTFSSALNNSITFELEYHSNGRVEFVSVGTQETCLFGEDNVTTYIVDGFPQLKTVEVALRAWEQYGKLKCGFEGTLWWLDGVTDADYTAEINPAYTKCIKGETQQADNGCSIHLKSNGVSQYSTVPISIIPGRPNVYDTLMRYLKVTIERPGYSTSVTAPVIVTGTIIDTGNVYSNEVPINLNEPLMILFDPPGDASYASVSKGKILSWSTQTEATIDGAIDQEFGAGTKSGIELTTCAGLGVSVCTKGPAVKLGWQTTVKQTVSDGRTYNQETGSTVTLSQTYKTSATNDLSPPDSDLIIVAVVSIQRTQTKTIKVQMTNGKCSPNLLFGFTFLQKPTGTAAYQVWDINNIMIPQLDTTIASMEANPPALTANNTVKNQYKNTLTELRAGKTKWSNVLRHHDQIRTISALRRPLSQMNSIGCPSDNSVENLYHGQDEHELSVNCDPTNGMMAGDTVFFTGGGQEYEFSSSVDATTHYQTYDWTDSQTSLEVAFEGDICGVTTSSKTNGMVNKHSSWTHTLDSTVNTAVSFVLSDSNLGDKFGVKIEHSTYYGTPVFLTLSGVSSCPWEPNTIQRQKAAIEISPSTRTNVPASLPAVYQLTITNQNEFHEEFQMGLQQDVLSNQGGLLLKLNGIPLTQQIPLTVKYPSSTYTLEAYRGVFGYDSKDVVIQLLSLCGDDSVAVQSQFDVHYLAPCPSINWLGDFATDQYLKYISNRKSPKYIQVDVQNPTGPTVKWKDISSFSKATLEYRAPGSRTWYPAKKNATTVIEFTEDASGYATGRIDVNTLSADGYYDLRLITRCNYEGSSNDPSLRSFISTTATILVDRKNPEMFGTFAEPADGVWVPGDAIGAQFSEELDCTVDGTTLDWGYRATNTATGQTMNFGPEFLDILCRDNKVSLAFSSKVDYNMIFGRKVTPFIKNFRDVAQNINPVPVTWSFTVPTFNKDQLAVQISGLFLDGMSITQYIANHPNALSWQDAFEEDMKAIDPNAKIVNVTIKETTVTTRKRQDEKVGIEFAFSIQPGDATTSHPVDVLNKLNQVIDNSTSTGTQTSLFTGASRSMFAPVLQTRYKQPSTTTNNTTPTTGDQTTTNTVKDGDDDGNDTKFTVIIVILVILGVGLVILAVGLVFNAAIVVKKLSKNNFKHLDEQQSSHLISPDSAAAAASDQFDIVDGIQLAPMTSPRTDA